MVMAKTEVVGLTRRTTLAGHLNKARIGSGVNDASGGVLLGMSMHGAGVRVRVT
jgi:hypothetical protein